MSQTRTANRILRLFANSSSFIQKELAWVQEPFSFSASDVCVSCPHPFFQSGSRRECFSIWASAVGGVAKLSVLSDLQLGGVGGWDAVASLHAVALLQLRQSGHEPRIRGVQRSYPLFLRRQKDKCELLSWTEDPTEPKTAVGRVCSHAGASGRSSTKLVSIVTAHS